MVKKKSKEKDLMQRGMMTRARCYVGMHGVTPRVIKRFCTAFNGTCIRPTPSDVIKVKIQDTFTGDIERAIMALCEASGAAFIGAKENAFIFYKPQSGENEGDKP